MADKKETIPCFRCGKKMYEVMPDFVVNQPNDGLAFTTEGHYGSKAYDPMIEGQFLLIVICDECLIDNKNNVVLGETRYTPKEVKYREYEPFNS